MSLADVSQKSLVFDDVTTGAVQDIRQATERAQRYGYKVWFLG